MAHTLFVPLMLTLGAGLATGIGSTIALFAHRTNKRLLSFSLGLSGGVFNQKGLLTGSILLIPL